MDMKDCKLVIYFDMNYDNIFLKKKYMDREEEKSNRLNNYIWNQRREKSRYLISEFQLLLLFSFALTRLHTHKKITRQNCARIFERNSIYYFFIP